MVAEFETPDSITKAAKRAREFGYTKLEAYTPFPVHGLDDAIGFRDSRVQWSIFFAGAIGLFTGFMLETYVSVIDNPWNIGGRPMFSWPSFIPVAYECTILFASFGAVISMFALNGLPQPYHPIFDAKNFSRASQDRFFLVIEGKDPLYDAVETKSFMQTLNAIEVSEVTER